MEVAGHRESNASLFIADIGRYDIILGLPWMKQHGVRLNPGAQQIAFQKGFCDHPGAAIEDFFVDMQPNSTEFVSTANPTSIRPSQESTVLEKTSTAFKPKKILPRTRVATPSTLSNIVAKAIAASGKILFSLASRAFVNQLPPIEAVTRPTKTKTTLKPKPKAQAKKAG